MTDRIELHQPTKSECDHGTKRCHLPVVISAELEITPPKPYLTARGPTPRSGA